MILIEDSSNAHHFSLEIDVYTANAAAVFSLISPFFHW